MCPDERRRMLISATLPLVAQHGLKVTTRQIADAAGVAEGTIFRVFPDKQALVRAAVAEALNPCPILDELAAVDLALPLRERLTTVTTILRQRFLMVFNLMIALGMHGPPKEMEEQQAAAKPQHAAIMDEIGRILEPDREKFRCPVPEVVRILRLLTFSGSHPLIAGGRLLTAAEIADVLLDGVLRHHDNDAEDDDDKDDDDKDDDKRG